ncbi:hypothetical protein BJ980_001467 [Nocardioides daedukensis]|uniref:Uncharacterized protein n=1 Tax=Nocardioides daedukensis TaxID=634462 RepID=A0A7Y9UTL6_9ACTN|nr:hypothetical protein [Nocardioides daedukensis]NYG58544.1 hypothetical protein [Nocardioides daedukensis]
MNNDHPSSRRSLDMASLVDWVEGRSGRPADERVHKATAEDAETGAKVLWIRDFLRAGRSMPLLTPPQELRNELRLAFRRYVSPGLPGDALEAALTFDSRDYAMASGMRSRGDDDVRHLVMEHETARLSLTVVNNGADAPDIQGLLTWSEPGPGYSELVFTRGDAFERAVRPGADGHFQIAGISRDVDEVWISRGPHLLRLGIDLTNRE